MTYQTSDKQSSAQDDLAAMVAQTMVNIYGSREAAADSLAANIKHVDGGVAQVRESLEVTMEKLLYMVNMVNDNPEPFAEVVLSQLNPNT